MVSSFCLVILSKLREWKYGDQIMRIFLWKHHIHIKFDFAQLFLKAGSLDLYFFNVCELQIWKMLTLEIRNVERYIIEILVLFLNTYVRITNCKKTISNSLQFAFGLPIKTRFFFWENSVHRIISGNTNIMWWFRSCNLTLTWIIAVLKKTYSSCFRTLRN